MLRSAAATAGHHARRRGKLDVRYGFALLRSPEVPLGKKGVALLIGIAVTVLLSVLEFPLETMLAVLMPFLGFGFDLAIDGFELLVLPVVFGSIVLTWMV